MASELTDSSETILPTLARNIKRAREERGLTQRELAAQVNGVDPLAVSRWERGKTIPGRENLQALAAALHRDTGWLYTEHEKAAA